MTNHIHLVVGTHGNAIETIMRDHKRDTAEQLHNALLQPNESRREWMQDVYKKVGTANKHNHGFQLWQQDYHPIALERREMVHQRVNYTHQNPVRAGFVERAEDWRYSSAAAYAGKHSILPCLKILDL